MLPDPKSLRLRVFAGSARPAAARRWETRVPKTDDRDPNGNGSEASSSLWHGTVFSIMFPPGDGGPANSAEVCVRAMVLLVEDDEDSRAIYGTVLRHAGFLVVEADDGEAAVESVRRHRPDMVVMDAGLPGMDGWDATAALKGDPETASVPILVLTVHSQPADLERAEAAGCDAYVVKPIDPASLAETVGRMIAENRVAGGAGGAHTGG